MEGARRTLSLLSLSLYLQVLAERGDLVLDVVRVDLADGRDGGLGLFARGGEGTGA
jgi:hypothetical protein